MSGQIDDQNVRQDAFTTILTAVQRAKDEAKTNEALLRRSFDAAHGEWELERAELIKEIDDLKRIQDEQRLQIQQLTPKLTQDARVVSSGGSATACCRSASQLNKLQAKYDRLSNDYKAETAKYMENKTTWKRFKAVVSLVADASLDFRRALADANRATDAELKLTAPLASVHRTPVKSSNTHQPSATKHVTVSPRKSPGRSSLTPLPLSSANRASPSRRQSSPTKKPPKPTKSLTAPVLDESYVRNVHYAEQDHPSQAKPEAGPSTEDEDYADEVLRQQEHDADRAAEMQVDEQPQAPEQPASPLRTVTLFQPTSAAAKTVMKPTLMSPFVFPLPQEAIVPAILEQDIIEESHVPSKRRHRTAARFSELRDQVAVVSQPKRSPTHLNAMTLMQHSMMQAEFAASGKREPVHSPPQKTLAHQDGLSTVMEEFDEEATEESGSSQRHQADHTSSERPPTSRASGVSETSGVTRSTNSSTEVSGGNQQPAPLRQKSAYASSRLGESVASARPVDASKREGNTDTSAYTHTDDASIHLEKKQQGPKTDFMAFVNSLQQPRARLGEPRPAVTLAQTHELTPTQVPRATSQRPKTAHDIVALPQFDAAFVKQEPTEAPKTWINLKSQRRQTARFQDLGISSSPQPTPAASSTPSAATSASEGRRRDHLPGHQAGQSVKVVRKPSSLGPAAHALSAREQANVTEAPVRQSKQAQKSAHAMPDVIEADLRQVADRIVQRSGSVKPVHDGTLLPHLKARHPSAPLNTNANIQGASLKKSRKRKLEDADNVMDDAFLSQTGRLSQVPTVQSNQARRVPSVATANDAKPMIPPRPLKYAPTDKKARLLAIEHEQAEHKYEVNPETAANACAQAGAKRTKAERTRMHAANCQCCQGYYEAKVARLPVDQRAAAIADMRDKISRHREELPEAESPPAYWQMAFPSTQEVQVMNEQANIQNQERSALKAAEAEVCGGRWRHKATT